MWGSCLTGGAAISLCRASSGTATDGGGVHGAVESVIRGEYGRRAGDAAVGAAGAGKGGIGEEGQAAVEARREARAQDEQQENTGCAYGTGWGEGEEGARGAGAQGGEGARRAGARRGNYPDGALNNHTGGHSAVAEGGGCAGPYLEGPPSCCGGPRPLVRVWLQGPGGWCQRQVGGGRTGCSERCAVYEGHPRGSGGWLGGGRCYGTWRRTCSRTTTPRSVSEELGGGEGGEGQARAQGGALGGIMVRWRWRR